MDIACLVQECEKAFASLAVVQPMADQLTYAMDLRVHFARGPLPLVILVQVARLRIRVAATAWELLVSDFEVFHTEVALEVEVASLGMLSQSPRVAIPQSFQKSYNSFLRHSHPLVRPPLEAESLLFLVQFQQTMTLKMVLPLVILDKLSCFL